MNQTPTDLEQLQRTVADLTAQVGRLQQTAQSKAEDDYAAKKLERLNYYRREDAQEWNLLTNRVNSYITSQSFLVSAFAVSMANPDLRFRVLFPVVVSAVGIIASLRAYPGIDGACKIIQLWHDKKETLLQDPCLCDFCDGRSLSAPTSPYHRIVARLTARSHIGKRGGYGKPSRQSCDVDSDQSVGERVDEIHITSLYFAHLAPKLFGYAWVVLLALALTLHFVHAR